MLSCSWTGSWVSGRIGGALKLLEKHLVMSRIPGDRPCKQAWGIWNFYPGWSNIRSSWISGSWGMSSNIIIIYYLVPLVKMATVELIISAWPSEHRPDWGNEGLDTKGVGKPPVVWPILCKGVCCLRFWIDSPTAVSGQLPRQARSKQIYLTGAQLILYPVKQLWLWSSNRINSWGFQVYGLPLHSADLVDVLQLGTGFSECTIPTRQVLVGTKACSEFLPYNWWKWLLSHCPTWEGWSYCSLLSESISLLHIWLRAPDNWYGTSSPVLTMSPSSCVSQ